MPTRKKLTAAARRAQLIEVAIEVFAEKGYDATSVEELADRAQISKPIVYEHFGGKEGLYAEVVDREMKHILEVIGEAIASGSPRERVEKASLTFLNYVKDRPNGFAVLTHDSPVTLHQGTLKGLLNDVGERVSELFADNFKRAGFDPQNAPLYAHALVGAVTFVGQWWTDVQKPCVEEVASHIAALAWMGLRHLPKEPASILEPTAS